MISGPTALELRPFDPDRDFPSLVDLICEVSAYDGDNSFPTTTSLALNWAPSPTFDPRRDVAVMEQDGRIIAAGEVEWRERDGKIIHGLEVWVRPEARRRGLGRRVLRWLEDRARASVDDGSGGPREMAHFLSGGSDQAQPAGLAFALDEGYAPIRYGFEMHRPLDLPIPELALPDGLDVRPVLPEHLRAIWDADTEAFRDHWEASVRHEADYVRFIGDPEIDTSMWQIAWDGEQVAGGVINGIYREENAKAGLDVGWLERVAVRRPWRRRGLASALIVRSLATHRDRGMAVAGLGVDAENPTGALGVYERLGFRVNRTWGNYRKPL